MIRMINQTGDGFADAYSEVDVESYISKGWKRYEDITHVEIFTEPAAAIEVETEAPKKRGRPAKVE